MTSEITRFDDFLQLLASVIQSLMLVNVGMELAMPTLVIGSIYKNSKAEFVLSNSQSSWYGKYKCTYQIPLVSVLVLNLYTRNGRLVKKKKKHYNF